MSIKAPSEKNFRRSKVKPVKKRRGVRLLLRTIRAVVPAAIGLYAVYIAVDLAVNASAFQVRKLAIRGNSRLSSGEVETLVEGLRGSSIITADLARHRQRLLRSPWVADAGMRRILPSTVEIYISERTPLGLCRVGHDVYLLDRTGTLIDEFGPQYARFDLPLIDGVVRRQAGDNSLIDENRTSLAARVIDAFAPHKALAARISQVDVTDLNNAVVLLDDDPALLHLGTSQFVERLRLYLQVAPALRERVAEMDYVDLRFDGRAYVRPLGGRPLQDAAAPRGTSGR